MLSAGYEAIMSTTVDISLTKAVISPNGRPTRQAALAHFGLADGSDNEEEEGQFEDDADGVDDSEAQALPPPNNPPLNGTTE